MKNHFAEYNDLKIKLNEYDSRIDVMKERLYSASGIRYDDAPKVRGQNSTITHRIQQIDDLIRERNKIEAKFNLVYSKHLKEIDVVVDEKKRSILRSYYLHRMSLKDIAGSYDVTLNHVSRLKIQAVKEFKEKNFI